MALPRGKCFLVNSVCRPLSFQQIKQYFFLFSFVFVLLNWSICVFVYRYLVGSAFLLTLLVFLFCWVHRPAYNVVFVPSFICI